jgi:hypothetical protein
VRDATAALNQLLMLAYDSVHAYSTALDRLRDEELRHHLEGFQLDHERHLSDLTAQILRLGGSPKSHRDLRGPLLQGMAAFSSMLGDGAGLRALARAEVYAMRAYASALELHLAEETELLLRQGLQDQVRHLAWLRPTLSARDAALHERASQL